MTVSILNKDVKEGDIVEFGRYMQKNDNDMDNIEWNVLDVKDGKALLLSRYALDFKQYNEKLALRAHLWIKSQSSARQKPVFKLL